jgi:hypothetical protein
MNQVQSAVRALSDEQLKEAIAHLKLLDENKAVPQGALRQVVGSLMTELRTTESDAIGFVRYALLETAAQKWAGVFE